MLNLIQLRFMRTATDKVSFMVLTATPTKAIIDKVYEVAGFTRPDHKVLYIRRSLNRPNIFIKVEKKTKLEVGIPHNLYQYQLKC